MAKGNFLFTSEAVSMGHPDKLADQISDGILDALFAKDPYSRVACETMVTTGIAIVAGEITTKAVIDYSDVVRQVIREVGYTDDKMGICADTCAVMLSLDRQSPDIAMGVNEDAAKGKEIGAGDQGLMFGYACNDTPELMPLPIQLAHQILDRLTEARRHNEVPWLRPDSKSQVTVEYKEHKPVRIDTVVVSTQHTPEVSQAEIRKFVIEKIVNPLLPKAPGQWPDHLSRQPHGPFRGRRAARRLRVDRPEDHRRYLRRLGAAWRRGLQRQGPHQGRPQCGLYGAARGQEHRRRRTGRTLRGATGLRHRRRRAGQRAGRYRGDGQDRRRAALRVGAPSLPLNAQRNHQGPRSPPAHLPQDGLGRTFWPQRSGLYLGADPPRRRIGGQGEVRSGQGPVVSAAGGVQFWALSNR